MILGMTTFTFAHVVLSLAGIVAGFVVLCGLFGSRRVRGWTCVFLATTLATTVTGFGFPIHGLTPALITGFLEMVALPAAILGLYVFRLAGPWRPIYVVGAVAALYLNMVALVAQGFLKVPALNALAPTGSEPAFGIAQLVLLAAFVVAGVRAARRFRPGA